MEGKSPARASQSTQFDNGQQTAQFRGSVLRACARFLQVVWRIHTPCVPGR
ncbi:Uncharacterised protein [Vibrio cholerae]|nr:Uncharacterised protein [Vibrio cholerae]